MGLSNPVRGHIGCLLFAMALSITASPGATSAQTPQNKPAPEAVNVEVADVRELRSAIHRLRANAGGAIYLKPGVYVLHSPLVVRATSLACIAGAGPSKTVVRMAGDGTQSFSRGRATTVRCATCGLRETFAPV